MERQKKNKINKNKRNQRHYPKRSKAIYSRVKGQQAKGHDCVVTTVTHISKVSFFGLGAEEVNFGFMLGRGLVRICLPFHGIG
jgi:hypothetical protein